ncbi:tyrosine-type recombinase/integrase [Urbifossiella limnaea]|uniref:Phage integrase family protein n=1 Tax=Urbifossiella limnaea TaxID=2528023 RepID=A0A517XWI0_9BACT|nr:tyrosine-type recombinase/integrase [Urbifossiella limnaea]QDU21862.1 Phage integrase family protein [Urbifossiella limnaea]
MPRPASFPSYRHHKPSGQAVVTIRAADGGRRDVYLGAYDSPESRREYARVVAELAVVAVPDQVATPVTLDPSVDEVLHAFWRHAEAHYRRADGTPTNEISEYRQTFRHVRALYGPTPARGFGPLALKAVRQRMVDAGWSRRVVNARVGRVRRAFKWAASEELVPAAVPQALATVGGLQGGRTAAPERDPVKPVDPDHVRVTLPFLRPPVRGMVEVQLLTGMRPGEVCRLRPRDIDISGDVWVYRPGQHKTRHRGKAREVAVGPRARVVLERFTPADPDDYFFSPRRSVEAFRAERAAARKTPRYASHMARNAAVRVASPKRAAAERYTVPSYDRAVSRAVEKANIRRGQLAGVGNYDPVPHWHPNQLRHAHGTEVRRRYGLEAAQVALGHERADVTQVYAEKNLALATRVAAEIG